MSQYSWRFPKLDNGAEQGINDSGIATFKGSALYNNLAREICQNSLDAKDERESMVEVVFRRECVQKNKFLSLSGLDDVINECEQYWEDRMDPKLRRFLDEAKTKLDSGYVDLLIMSDYHTTGLSGAKAAKHAKSKWRALTHSNGVTEKGKGSAGSHGIGKNAPFACSNFRTVFYNSFSKEDNVKAFQGVSRLVTHTHDGEDTQGTGFFQNTTTGTPIFEEDQCDLRDLLNRTSYGTDVVIAGFKRTSSWAEDIEKAVLSNFFVSIYNERLKVEVDGTIIDKSTLKSRIEFYASKEKNLPAQDRIITTILEFYSAISEPTYIISGSIMEPNDVSLFIKVDDKYSKSIAEMRSIGMVIRKRHNNIFTRYAAVMIVHDGALNELLKETEPPAHDEWDPGLLSDDPEQEDKARKYRKNLISWTNNVIIEKCRSESTDEMDLDGVSAFLPFDEDDKALSGLDGEKSDASPDSTHRFDDPKKGKTSVHKSTMTAKKVTGRKNEDFDPHNETGGGTSGGSAGVEDPSGEDKVTAPVEGKASVNIPKVLHQRIISTPANSIYRLAFMLENDCPKINLAIKAIGDDGTKETLTIKEYKIEKVKKPANASQITLFSIKAGVMNEVFVTLEYSEKMALELLLY